MPDNFRTDAHVHVFTTDMPLIDNPRHAPKYSFTHEELVATLDNNVGNIWRQPLTGGPPRQITDFKDKLIATFNWSRDNKLICARGILLRDAVLISDVR